MDTPVPVAAERLDRPLRVAQVAPPIEPIPPGGYGGTERIIDELGRELARRGHEVVLFASGDSQPPGRLIQTVPLALRGQGFKGDPSPWFVATQLQVLRHQAEFDVIHSHLDFHSVLLARAATTPVVGTFHGRLDTTFAESILRDRPSGLVAISHGQAAQRPDVPWAAVVYNGLSLRHMPFGAAHDGSLAFVGRITEEKGILDAIEVARLTGRTLRIAAKDPWLPSEIAYYQDVFEPARSRADVELLGELGPADRDALLATSYATLMPSTWPEPFGLAAIESLACGTPVLGRGVGGLPEVVRDGIDGFLADDAAAMAARVEDVAGLDRFAIRASVLERFSAERMADGYEDVYARAVADGQPVGPEVN
ncbi:glycosyltransferase family 4 protein [soil metagenome]